MSEFIKPGFEDKFDEVDKRILDTIAEHGWTDMAIFPTQEGDGVPFNYTVGLTKMHDHPDLVVLGMGNEQMHGVLTAAVRHVQEGVVYQANTTSDEIIEGYDVAWVKVFDPRNQAYPMSMATRLQGSIKALQLVWPDREGLFPWDLGCDAEMANLQPMLGIWKGEIR